MLNLLQTWLIYPDDIERLRKCFKKAGFQVYKDSYGFWNITTKKEKKKSVGLKHVKIVKDGPFRGVRVENVALFDTEKAEQVLIDNNWGVTITKQDEKGVCLFIYDLNKKDIYEQRLQRRR